MKSYEILTRAKFQDGNGQHERNGRDVIFYFDIYQLEWRRLLKTKLLLHKRKLYLTYGMVLCLVTLTEH